MKTLLSALAMLLTLVTPRLALAQAPAVPPAVPPPVYELIEAQELVLDDGSRVYGAVVSESATEVVFRTTAGATITAPRSGVVSLRRVAGRMVRGEFRRDDPNNTRLFFGPTGRALPRGEVYLGVYEFLMPFVQVGVTDRISIGGGTPLLFGLADESTRPFWITPKVQLVSGGRTHVAAGVFHMFSGAGDAAGIAYGVLTQELASGSVTFGAGMKYSAFGEPGPVAMLGADAPMRRNMKLVTENYVWGDGGVASAGVRFFGENLSADLALGVFFSSDGVFGAPVVNFVYRF